MNINDFENHIDKRILDRGYDYYINENIVETYDQGDNEYVFQVQGSEDYEVVVKIDDHGKIIYSECDCPYDFGPVCKHQVAAYFKLFDILNAWDNKLSVKKEVSKQTGIKGVLNNLTKEELIKIIMDITQKDSTLKNSIIVRYSRGNNKQELEKCKRLIESIVRKYTDREGFISYGGINSFAREMGEVLEKVRDTDDILLALDISFLLLKELVEAFQYSDDSDGEIGCLVEETIEAIGEIVTDSNDLDMGLREKIFNKLLEESDSKVFNGWEDYRINILNLCTEFADMEDLRNEFRRKIEYAVNKNSEDEYKKYSNERMLQILFELIEAYGTEEEALEFVKENLEYASFKELLIDKFIEENNYHKVIELTLEWEKEVLSSCKK